MTRSGATSRSFSHLAPRQLLSLDVFSITGSVDRAAEAANVSPRTVRRWLALPTFQHALRVAGRDRASEATSLLFAAQRDAVACLVAALSARSDATRVRAARALLEIGMRAASDDLETRLSDLERRYEKTWTRGTASTGWTS